MTECTAYEESAAIMEFSGGLTRENAEMLARILHPDIPSLFRLDGVSYRFVSVENDTAKCLLLAGNLGFIFKPVADVLERGVAIPEPE